jgi:hypothetical protein
MLNIFNNKLRSVGISLVHGKSTSASSFKQIAKLPRAQQEYLRQKAEDGIVVAFLGISAFMWVGVLTTVFLDNVSIKKSTKDTNTYEDGETDVGRWKRT